MYRAIINQDHKPADKTVGRIFMRFIYNNFKKEVRFMTPGKCEFICTHA